MVFFCFLLEGGPRIVSPEMISFRDRIQATKADSDNLADILQKTAEYCEKLKQAALHFVCQEEITERMTFIRQKQIPKEGGMPWTLQGYTIEATRQKKNQYLYDYQMIQMGGRLEETRRLLKENGREKNVPGADLKTLRYQYKYVILGPVGILGRDAQSQHDYRIIGEEKVGGDRAVVLEAIPKPGIKVDHLYGKAWIRKTDNRVLKIEWRPESLGNIGIVEEQARKAGVKVEVIAISEYSVETNGILFPSKYMIKEDYIIPYNETLQIDRSRSRLSIYDLTAVYKDYKFFTVSTDVTIKEPHPRVEGPVSWLDQVRPALSKCSEHLIPQSVAVPENRFRLIGPGKGGGGQMESGGHWKGERMAVPPPS